MAQQPTTEARSHGRGGAGNINSKPGAQVQTQDLQTPTLKSATYTTGRGGSGNMARNDPTNPSEARQAQDVETPLHHTKEMQGTYHWGRGGEGNVTTVGKSGAEQARAKSKERQQQPKTRTLSSEDSAERRGSFQAAINKGREMLGLKRGVSTSQDPKNESAIE